MQTVTQSALLLQKQPPTLNTAESQTGLSDCVAVF